MEWPTALVAPGGASPPPQPLVLGSEVGVLGPGSSLCGLGEVGPQPLGALASSPGALFTGGGVVAGAHPSPRRQPLGGAEAGHVHPDLCDDPLRRAPVDPDDGVEQCELSSERSDHDLDLGRDAGDDLVQEVELGQLLPPTVESLGRKSPFGPRESRRSPSSRAP